MAVAPGTVPEEYEALNEEEPIEPPITIEGAPAAAVLPSNMSLLGPRDKVCNPCCCCSLRRGSVVIGALLALFGIASIALFIYMGRILEKTMFTSSGKASALVSRVAELLENSRGLKISACVCFLVGAVIPGIMLIVAAILLSWLVAALIAIWNTGGAVIVVLAAFLAVDVVKNLDASQAGGGSSTLPPVQLGQLQQIKDGAQAGIWIIATPIALLLLYAGICAFELFRQIRNGEYQPRPI